MANLPRVFLSWFLNFNLAIIITFVLIFDDFSCRHNNFQQNYFKKIFILKRLFIQNVSKTIFDAKFFINFFISHFYGIQITL